MDVHIFTAVFLQPRCSTWLTWHSEGTNPSYSENLQYLVSSVLCMLIIFSWKGLQWRAILKLERKTSVLFWKSELDMETTQISINRRMFKENTAHTHKGELLSLNKEGGPAICGNTDEAGDCYKWNTPDSEGQTLLPFICVWKLLSHVWLFETPWTIQSMGFSWAELLEWVASCFCLQGIFPTQR